MTKVDNMLLLLTRASDELKVIIMSQNIGYVAPCKVPAEGTIVGTSAGPMHVLEDLHTIKDMILGA